MRFALVFFWELLNPSKLTKRQIIDNYNKYPIVLNIFGQIIKTLLLIIIGVGDMIIE